MITKLRNRALLQMAAAIVLTVSFVVVCIKLKAMRYVNGGVNLNDWGPLFFILYFGSYTMWVLASLSLSRAKGYHRDFGGSLFLVCLIIGCCVPVAPILFPFYIIFGLDDKTKTKRRNH